MVYRTQIIAAYMQHIYTSAACSHDTKSPLHGTYVVKLLFIIQSRALVRFLLLDGSHGFIDGILVIVAGATNVHHCFRDEANRLPSSFRRALRRLHDALVYYSLPTCLRARHDLYVSHQCADLIKEHSWSIHKIRCL